MKRERRFRKQQHVPSKPKPTLPTSPELTNDWLRQVIAKTVTPTPDEVSAIARDLLAKRVAASPAMTAFLGGIGRGLGEGLMAAAKAASDEKPPDAAKDALGESLNGIPKPEEKH